MPGVREDSEHRATPQMATTFSLSAACQSISNSDSKLIVLARDLALIASVTALIRAA